MKYYYYYFYYELLSYGKDPYVNYSKILDLLSYNLNWYKKLLVIFSNNF